MRLERRGKGARRGKPPVLRAGAAVTEHRLRNGLQLLVAERHNDPVVAVLLFYRVGSRDESEVEAGLSHFLEHMMFKGSASYPKGEVDRITTELGGMNNAFTSTDHTAYWFEFASDRWEEALAIEADRMRSLALDPVEFEAERDVVLEELSMGEDDPWRLLGRRVERVLFPRHPYGRPIIGYEDTLQDFRVADMRDYYRRYYHPANATLVVCGDVTPTAALRAVRKHLGGIEGRDVAAPRRPPLRPPGAEHRLHMTWDDPAARLCVAWPAEAVATPEDAAFDVLGAVLTSGRSSRLYRRLVLDEGLATSISSYNDARVLGGSFWIQAEASQGVPVEELERVIDEELDRLREDVISAAERKRALSTLVASDAFDGETVSDVAEQIGEFAVDADWRLALDGCARQLEVRPAALRDLVRRYLVDAVRVTGTCTPGARNGGA